MPVIGLVNEIPFGLILLEASDDSIAPEIKPDVVDWRMMGWGLFLGKRIWKRDSE